MITGSTDVQSETPRHLIPVDWVTVSNLRLPLEALEEHGVRLASMPVIRASVALPANQRGIHASRTYEAITSALSDFRGGNGNIAAEMARKLLALHSYGMASRVVITAQAVFLERAPVSGADSYQAFNVLLRADGLRGLDGVRTREFLGVKVAGMTACPCAKEVIRNIYVKEEAGSLPIGTHMQRAYATIVLEGHDGVRLSDLTYLGRSCFSNGTVEYLKRLDEAKLVVNAIENPKFVEDVAREIVYKMAVHFTQIPDKNMISVKVKALESIHDHDLEARLKTTFGEARRRIGI